MSLVHKAGNAGAELRVSGIGLRHPETRSASSLKEQASAIQQNIGALFRPRGFILGRQLVQIRRRRSRIIDPLTQQLAAIDQVDGEPRLFVFVMEVAPQRVLAAQPPYALECARQQAPRAELAMAVGAIVDVDLEIPRTTCPSVSETWARTSRAAVGSRAATPARCDPSRSAASADPGPARLTTPAAAWCHDPPTAWSPRASLCRRKRAPSTGSAHWGSDSPSCARPAASRSRAPHRASSRCMGTTASSRPPAASG